MQVCHATPRNEFLNEQSCQERKADDPKVRTVEFDLIMIISFSSTMKVDNELRSIRQNERTEIPKLLLYEHQICNGKEQGGFRGSNKEIVPVNHILESNAKERNEKSRTD